MYSSVIEHYKNLSKEGVSDLITRKIARDGYAIISNFLDSDTVLKMASYLTDRRLSLYSEPQSPAVHTLHNASAHPVFSDFFKNEEIIDCVHSIIGPTAEMVRDWAQIRLAYGYTGSFDEFFHIDSYKHRLKIFLYLSEVDAWVNCLTICPGMNFGDWHTGLARQLYYIEHKYMEHWESEADSYNTISSDRVNQFAGTLTPFDSDTLLRKADVKPVDLIGSAGTLIIWDSRTLHKHTVGDKNERLMLEMVFSQSGSY